MELDPATGLEDWEIARHRLEDGSAIDERLARIHIADVTVFALPETVIAVHYCDLLERCKKRKKKKKWTAEAILLLSVGGA